MKGTELLKFLEDWAPPGVAWEKDNVGLQTGSPGSEISGILLCLEVTSAVVEEAVKRKCNCIISHHPLIFKPLKKINPDSDKTAQILTSLIKNDISLFSFHTNLDFTIDGVSFVLAETLGLTNIQFLTPLDTSMVKLTVFVPEEALNRVSDAIFSAGGGVIGNYTGCSFRSNGIGTFRGNEKSNPTIGTKLNNEYVHETRLEILVDEAKLSSVLTAMRSEHPYEEPAFDIYRLANKTGNFGAGAIGVLPEPEMPERFLARVAEKLAVRALRYCNGNSETISKVAVCGGSGSDLLNQALRSGADAFVTADIKYHSYHDADGRIYLIDAGHFETEAPIIAQLEKRILQFLKKTGAQCEVYKYPGTTNPVQIFTIKE